MASLHKHSSGRSPYWWVSYQGVDGKFKFRSTKQKDRSNAMAVAQKLERAARAGRSGTLTENHLRKLFSDVLEETTGDSIRQVSTRQFLKDWLLDKEASRTPATVANYRNVFELFLESLGDKAGKSIGAVNPRDIQNFLNGRLKAKRATKTVSVDRKTLPAVKRNWIKTTGMEVDLLLGDFLLKIR